MPRQKITKTRVDIFPVPARGQAFLRDNELVGFALCVRASGTRSFVLERRMGERNRRVTIGRYPDLTVEEARAEAKKLLGQLALGISPLAGEPERAKHEVTLEQAFADFRRVRRSLKPRTVYDYEKVLQRSFANWLRLPLREITKDMIVRRHGELGERSGPAYANYAMRLMRAIYNFAIYQYEDRDGRPTIPFNPVNRLSHTRSWYRVPRRKTVIRAHQLGPWLAAVEELRRQEPLSPARTCGDYLLVLLLTGLRRQEGARLRWADIDLRSRILTVGETKNGTPLELPLSSWLYEILAEREAMALGEYVFPGGRGAGYLIEPRKHMLEVIRRSGVPFVLHDLRRTFVTVAEGLDISAFAIKRLVNHRMSGDVTAGYIVSSPERLREPMERITRFIRGCATSPMPAPVLSLPAPDAEKKLGGYLQV